jgi:CRP-like cAMP-binding protein
MGCLATQRQSALPHTENHLIELLPRQDRLRFLSVCEQVDLPLAQVVCESGAPMRHAYFPTSGLISLEAAIDAHAGLEVGMVGHEGMLGAHLAHGIAIAPWRALVQGAGVTRRVDMRAFQAQLVHSIALQRILSRYSYVTLAQFSMSMGCQRFHQLGARFCRWLLMRHDRATSDSFFVTHESLGHMLGVRRVSVTIAAGALQNQGFITYSRGMLSVLDRHGLEACACSCYARDRSLYAQFLPTMKKVDR